MSDDVRGPSHDQRPAPVPDADAGMPAAGTSGGTAGSEPGSGAAAGQDPPDLDLIEADLAAVEVALERLDSGEYWRDEATGEPLDDAMLQQHPTVRRAP